jgi:hypothetical protein
MAVPTAIVSDVLSQNSLKVALDMITIATRSQ